MAEANWYWMAGEQRNGPVTPGAIARLVAEGKLIADSFIWKEGMADWITVGRVPALAKYLPQPAAAAAATTSASTAGAAELAEHTEPMIAVEQPPNAEAVDSAAASVHEVGYYNPSGSLPPRAAATLRRHAPPRGDVGTWPLSDAQVAEFDEALKLRKRIDGAASLFRVLFLIVTIADVCGLAALLAAVGTSRGGFTAYALGSIFGAGAVYVGITVLYYFAWKGTVKSQAWAPLTMGILFAIAAAFYVVVIGIGAASNSSRDVVPMLIGGVVGTLFVGAFAYVSFRGYAAIGPYLQRPAWCQELLSKTSGK